MQFGKVRTLAWTRRFDAPGGFLEKGVAYGSTNGIGRLFRVLGRHRDHRSRDVEKGVKNGVCEIERAPSPSKE